MRLILAALTTTLVAAPAAAEPAKRAPVELPAALGDPAMADKMGAMMGALTRAMMDVNVGELQAAVEGRRATAAEKRRTVRDLAGKNDPNFERRIAEQTAAGGKTMQAATKALVASLPAILSAMDGAAEQIERAAANLPDPTYPKR